MTCETKKMICEHLIIVKRDICGDTFQCNVVGRTYSG
jgi:hypothetical protein